MNTDETKDNTGRAMNVELETITVINYMLKDLIHDMDTWLDHHKT